MTSTDWKRSTEPVLATLQDLVAIDSVNPGLPGGEAGEAATVEYLADFFAGLDVPYELSEVVPGRHNIIATLPGQDPDRQLLLECHMDTASVEVMTIPPFVPEVRDGLMYGRGSCDTKAGGAAMLHAIKRIRDAGVVPPRSIVYAGCVDEEHLMRGSRQLAEQLSPSAAIIAEPTDLTVIRAHKGAVRFRVLVFGKAAHSSKPYLGINAISKMAALIGHIERAVQERLAGAVDPLLGASTLNIGVISGGQQVNFVPDQCSIDVDVRIVPGQTTAAVLDAFAAAIALAQQDDPELQAVVEPPFFSGAPLGTPETEQLVQTALQACNAVAGNAAAAGVPYGTDGCALGERGVPTIVLGPGSIDQAHGAVEWVECRQVVQAVDIYERIMLAESSAF